VMLKLAKLFGTQSGFPIALASVRASSSPSTVGKSLASAVTIVRGHSFRVQVLWGARIDHADHVHVGIKAL
jgi:hypothetical protein